jgi:hypothetical protein
LTGKYIGSKRSLRLSIKSFRKTCTALFYLDKKEKKKKRKEKRKKHTLLQFAL